MHKSVLILGASGRFGRNARVAFSWAGWDVPCFDRTTDRLPDAAWGADVIVNAWNPAYQDWKTLVPKLTESVISTAKETGATVIIPGNIYSYGPDIPSNVAEETPHGAVAGLGKIRKDMEDAYRSSGVRTIVLRAGDFIDIEASGNWYDKVITAQIADGNLVYPGDPEAAHAWAFLPDMAEAAVQLAEKRDALRTFEEVLFPGFTLTGFELQRRLSQVLRRDLRLKTMQWLPIYLASPVWKMARHLLEMRYLWNKPHRLKSNRFYELLPEFNATPVNEALEQSLPDDIRPNRKMPKRLSLDLSGRTRHGTVAHG